MQVQVRVCGQVCADSHAEQDISLGRDSSTVTVSSTAARLFEITLDLYLDRNLARTVMHKLSMSTFTMVATPDMLKHSSAELVCCDMCTGDVSLLPRGALNLQPSTDGEIND